MITDENAAIHWAYLVGIRSLTLMESADRCLAAWTLIVNVNSYHDPQLPANEYVLKIPEARHLNAANCWTSHKSLVDINWESYSGAGIERSILRYQSRMRDATIVFNFLLVAVILSGCDNTESNTKASVSLNIRVPNLRVRRWLREMGCRRQSGRLPVAEGNLESE